MTAVPNTAPDQMPDNVRDAYLRLAQSQCPEMTAVYEMAARSTDIRERRAVDRLFTYVAELMQRECDHLPGERVPDEDDEAPDVASWSDHNRSALANPDH